MALSIALPAVAVLALAAWLTPAPSGLGTHRQLGELPACGWIAVADLPCPTCGMTTAFAHAANGNLIASFLAQPLGCLLAICVAMTLLGSVYVCITGSRLERALAPLCGRRMAWAVSTLVVAAWLYKIVSYKGWIG